MPDDPTPRTHADAPAALGRLRKLLEGWNKPAVQQVVVPTVSVQACLTLVGQIEAVFGGGPAEEAPAAPPSAGVHDDRTKTVPPTADANSIGARVLSTVRASATPLKPADVARTLELDTAQVRQTLFELRSRGLVRAVAPPEGGTAYEQAT